MHQIDLRGSIAPLSLLKITFAFRAVERGECLEVVSDDPALRKEIDQVLRRFPHTVERIENEADFFRIRIRKNSTQVNLSSHTQNL
ncbi:MAG: sulfurtransferase TusA family protein [Desulfobacterales bacterium]